MSIQRDTQHTQEDINQPLYEQQIITQPPGPPRQPPPHPPSRPLHGRRGRWFVAALIAVLVLIVALGSAFAVQLLTRPGTQPTPAPTRAAPPTPVSTQAPTPTPVPPAGAYQPINALWMSSATTGWARTTTHRILRTTDGGNHWQEVTPPYPAGTSTEISPAFASLNSSVAWIAVSGKQQPNGTLPNVVFRTSNGGHIWQEATLPSSSLGVSQVQFVNAQDGWVLAEGGGGAAGSQAADLFRSTDGGRTWSIVAHAPGALPFAGIKNGMGWASATTGWITGSSAANAVYLYRTQDGGVSWQPQSLPVITLAPVTAPPVFFSATEGLLPVTISTAQGPGFAVYATHDGGATWSGPTPPFFTRSPGWTWNFLTMQQGWLVGFGDATLYKTSDAGQHWTVIPTSANFQFISKLDFISTQEGWAINTTNAAVPMLLKTTNGGLTWVQVSPSPQAASWRMVPGPSEG